MKTNRRGLILVILGAAAVAIGFQNCSKTNFSQSEQALSALGFGTVVQPPPDQTVCGAFDASGQTAQNCDVTHAFTGNLFVEPRDQLVLRVHGDPNHPIPAGADASIAGISQNAWLSGMTVNGVFTPYTIVATSFDTVANPFSNGFVTQSGNTVTIPDASGTTANVSAWFAIRMDGLFHLSSGDTPGVAYQFAVFADDAARIYVQPPGGALQMIVDDQTPQSVVNPGHYIPGTQYVRMGCSVTFNDASTIQTFVLGANQTMPMRLTYYQGPVGLSLRLMYRAVPAAGPNDSFCETDVNSDPSTKSTVVKASPVLDPGALAAHGWKVIDSSNLGAL